MKTYVLDTNTLLVDSEAIYKFEDNNVQIPIVVLEELDKFKKEQSELGRNARQTARNLDALREQGNLAEGVVLPGGGTLRVTLALSRILCRLPLGLDENIPDNQILAVAIECGGILVTRDINLRIKAAAVGVPAEDYKDSSVRVDEFYTGTGKGWVSGEGLIKIYSDKKLELADVTLVDMEVPYPNQCITVHSMDNDKQAALTMYDAVMKEFVLIPSDVKTLGLSPKNSEQQYALSLMLNENINLVSLIGKAGSGKTLLALAAALHGVLETKRFTKLLILKPIVSVGNSHKIGYLPGSAEEKLAPWLASYFDNISYIMGEPTFDDEPLKKSKKKETWEDKSAARVTAAEELMALGLLECGSLETLRGRSLPNQVIIIDECQSLTNHELKTIVTRAGEGSSIFILGDIEQVDLPYLSADNNGLVFVCDRFKNCDIAGHITLTKTVRSKLAELAAELL